MRRQIWSGAAAMVALSFTALACGEKSISAPATPDAPGAPGTAQIALLRRFDTLAVDQSVQLTAVVPALPGYVAPSVTWASSDTNVAVVTRNGVLFALKSGRATVSASLQGYSDATAVTVRPGIRGVEFLSDSIAISLAQSVKLPYRVTDTDGNPVDLTRHSVEWISTAPDVVPLTGDATVTGRAIGNAELMLRVDNKIGSTNVRVLAKPVATVSVSPSSLAIEPGLSEQLNVATMDNTGTVLTGRKVNYTSSNTAVATVSASGLVTAVAAGTADIDVNAEGRKVTVPVTVTAASTTTPTPPVASIAVSLAASTVTAGATTKATAILKDANNTVLTGRAVVWSSTNPAIATVDASGVVTAVGAGQSAITATAEGKSGSATVNVLASTSVASVSLSVPSSVQVGKTVQATATPKDGSGNVVSNVTVAWVSSDAKIATVSSTGLVTGVSGGSVSITASAGGSSADAVVTSVAPTPTVRSITLSASSSTLMMGDLMQVSAVVRDASDNPITNVPITWSSSAPGVATVSSSGLVAGVSVGGATITAQADTVRRSLAITVIDSTTVVTPTSPPSGGGGNGTFNAVATVAELPRATVSTTYPTAARQVRVAAGADLQAALDAAQPGDELLLAPGATWTGNFYMRNKGTSTGWITVRTDVSDAALGAPGTRMTPSRAGNLRLARIITPNSQPALETTLSAHHWRVTGVEIATTYTSEVYSLIEFGDGSSAQNSLSLVAHDLVLDRSWVHGTPTQIVRRCVSLQSATSAVIDSWMSDCHSNNSDSQAIIGWNGPGPYQIQNNHLEGGHQAIMFGGADPWITNLIPSDITIVGNDMTRPLSWQGVWTTKTIFESKNSKRVLLEGNILENVWISGQVGYAFVMKSEDQNGRATWTQTADITVRYNLIRTVGSAFNIAAKPGVYPAVPAARFTIHDNLVQNLGYAGEGIPLQLLDALSDVIVAHNTFMNAVKKAVSLDGGVMSRIVIHSNVLPNGTYGVQGTGQPVGTASINYYMPGGVFAYDQLVGGNCSVYPATTTCPSTIPASQPAGYDGRAIGADLAKVNAMTSGVSVAP
jgi:uncharacterized protein YjdB